MRSAVAIHIKERKGRKVGYGTGQRGPENSLVREDQLHSKQQRGTPLPPHISVGYCPVFGNHSCVHVLVVNFPINYFGVKSQRVTPFAVINITLRAIWKRLW